MDTIIIEDRIKKQKVARAILEALPEWFGIPEAREDYITKSADQTFIATYLDDNLAGFLCLEETGKDTIELYVMGVRKEYHRKGIGGTLVSYAKRIAQEAGYSFLQVKTVQMGRYPEYDGTNRFYLAQGFKELEVFPNLWGEANPCQIYVMSL